MKEYFYIESMRSFDGQQRFHFFKIRGKYIYICFQEYKFLPKTYSEVKQYFSINEYFDLKEIEVYCELANGQFNSQFDNTFYSLKDGLLHAEDGPAFIVDSANANSAHIKNYEEYYLDGKEYSLNEFLEKQKDTPHIAKIIARILGNNNEKDNS